MIIYVGKKDRDGITQEQSLSVWAIYDNYLPFKVEVIPSTVAPIRDVYDYAKEHPNTEVLWVIGAREENQDDFRDIAARTKSITKYPNLELRTIVTKGNVSGTAARNALEKSPEAFYDYIPEFLSDKEKKEIYTTLKGTINEIGDLSVEPYNWNADLNKTDKNDPYDYYDFTTDDGIKYQVVFLREPIGNDAYINYDMSFVAKGGGDKGFSANALTGGNEPLKVMSTVVDITKSHMEYKGDADFITFEPTKGKTGEESAKDSTRGKLYKLIIKKNFPKAQVTGTDKVTVDVSAYKGEDLFEAISPDNSYSFKVTDKTRDEEDNSLITVEYKFSTPDNTYRVEFYSGEYRPEDKTFDLSFGVDAGGTNAIDTFQMTGEGNARKIFKTILNIVEDFLNKEDVEKIIVDGTSEKRKRIYKSIFSTSNLSDKVIVKEAVVGDKIVCDNCGWDWKIEDGGDDLYVCHKCWHDNTPKSSLNEEASYSQYIDVKQKIKELTKHMLDKGMNITPLPKVIFKHGDSSNAKEFLGQTAYYDPNSMSIVLYTEGRHPKDIVRSFSHEMIHHIQNLEDRLGNITTTNTQEDDSLNDLEAEANLKGTMTFRNWTDSLQEGKTKDPFGLNAFAHELAMLREDEGEYKIYLDMDGVVADFDQRFRDLSGMSPDEFTSKYGKNAFWDFIDEGNNKIKFWVGIPPMEGAKELVDYVSQHDYSMLTAPSIKKQSRLGKNLWIRNHTGDVFPSKPHVIFKSAKTKHLVKPSLTKFDILIDDKQSTIDNWNNAGGTGILYLSASQVISQLQKLGL